MKAFQMDKTIKIKIGNFESDYNDLLRIYISISKLNLENNGSNKSLKYLLQHNCLDSGVYSTKLFLG